MSGRILITPRSLTSGPHPQIARLREAGFEIVTSTPNVLPSEEELISRLPGCTGWLAGIEPVSERVIHATSDLRIISRNGTGVDNLPMDLLAQKNIKVAIAGGANAAGVAELAIALIFAALRHVLVQHGRSGRDRPAYRTDPYAALVSRQLEHRLSLGMSP